MSRQHEPETQPEPGSEPLKGVLIRVPADLHRDLKLAAVRSDTSIQALMVDAIREMIARINAAR